MIRQLAALAAMSVVLFGRPSLADEAMVCSASSTQTSSSVDGPADGVRFDLASHRAWAGEANQKCWFWQVDFGAPRSIGAVLQVVGDHEFVMRNAPCDYAWQCSDDGEAWNTIEGASASDESRLYRLHRFAKPVVTRFLRMAIASAHGEYPVLREVEFFAETEATPEFPEWIVAVNVTHDGALPGAGQEFIPLAKASDRRVDAAKIEAQQVWLTNFSPEYLAIEPRPLCAFLSGSFRDWCEVDREHWRGVERVLRARTLPLWASCGGAQGLAIVSEYGVDRPWDCPHCRDANDPKTPLYEHIGHDSEAPHVCGDYSHCLFERGKHELRRVAEDDAFAGLADAFDSMESHCGQVAWTPKGWKLLVTCGQGGKTKTQCLRLTDYPIYAAQFHIEMEGTPKSSRIIAANFLDIARRQRDSAAD